MPIQHDDNPSMNAASVARFEDISIPTLNRRIREGAFPRPDFMHGPLRYWLRSTVLAARAQRMAKSAEQFTAKRAEQLRAAESARVARERKRAERAAAEESSTV
jgi:predicted DNA-binding transcriptional regulator AlpA